jgi:hypothetical protein
MKISCMFTFKHLVEAEKSTFRGYSVQQGLQLLQSFVLIVKIILWKNQ